MTIKDTLDKLLAKKEEEAKQISTIYGQLKDDADILLDSVRNNLEGEYELYCIYKDDNENVKATYGLMYADYECQGNIKNEEDFLLYYSNDALILANKLKESGLALDYFCIMPYFKNEKGQSILYNTYAIHTNEL